MPRDASSFHPHPVKEDETRGRVEGWDRRHGTLFVGRRPVFGGGVYRCRRVTYWQILTGGSWSLRFRHLQTDCCIRGITVMKKILRDLKLSLKKTNPSFFTNARPGEDRKMLAELQSSCSAKASAYEQRTAQRSKELIALQETKGNSGNSEWSFFSYTLGCQ